MKKLFNLFLAILIFSNFAIAQDLPITNQIYFNPYFYNPAFLNDKDPLEINTSYRKQWADIQNAPSIISLNAQHATKGNFSFGLSIYSQDNVALVSNTAYLTAAYKVNFSHDHFVKFGLSIGTIQNTIDQNEISNYPELLNDISVQNSVDNTFYLSSQFGVHYQLNRLSLGLAFPKFFENTAYSENSFNNPSLDQLRQFITNVSYDFVINDNIAFKPIALLRYTESNYYQAEATGIINYAGAFWFGAGYRYESGVIGHMGFNLKESVSFNYSYEANGINSTSFGGATHEVHLKFRLKRKNKLIGEKIEIEPEKVAEKPKAKPAEQVSIDSTKNQSKELKTDTVKTEKGPTPLDSVKQTKTEPIVTDQEMEAPSTLSKSLGMGAGYYVIVGVFSNKENAEKHSKNVDAEGFPNKIYYNESNGYFYVSLLKTAQLNEAQEKRNYMKKLSTLNFSKAWLLEIK